MTPAHAATLAALSSVVAALGESKSKDCKAILKDLKKNHDFAVVNASAYSADHGGELSGADYVSCCLAMGIHRTDIEAGAEPCIVEGRYAVRTKDGLKLGPKVA